MAHLVPQYQKGAFLQHEASADCIPERDYREADHGPRDEYELLNGWFVRLSADGFLDCTEWEGPFESKEDAREHVEHILEVDPDSGEPLGFDDFSEDES